jgi:hypothetical protein
MRPELEDLSLLLKLPDLALLVVWKTIEDNEIMTASDH